MQNNINNYKNQLVNTITENDPNHKVEQPLLYQNETAKPIITSIGRQQHLRQSLKYLMDTATKTLQKIKTKALHFINQVTEILTPNTDNLSSRNLQSRTLDPTSIQPSTHPMDHRKEEQLEKDPIVKLKKTILIANKKQLEQVNDQITQSLSKQVEEEDDLQR